MVFGWGVSEGAIGGGPFGSWAGRCERWTDRGTNARTLPLHSPKRAPNDAPRDVRRDSELSENEIPQVHSSSCEKEHAQTPNDSILLADTLTYVQNPVVQTPQRPPGVRVQHLALPALAAFSKRGSLTPVLSIPGRLHVSH